MDYYTQNTKTLTDYYLYYKPKYETLVELQYKLNKNINELKVRIINLYIKITQFKNL